MGQPKMKKKILGPGMEEKKNILQMDIPSCVNVKTPEDNKAFQGFVSEVVKATRKNCLDLLAAFVEEQNAAMATLVKKLS